jgi:hypothetical protein
MFQSQQVLRWQLPVMTADSLMVASADRGHPEVRLTRKPAILFFQLPVVHNDDLRHQRVLRQAGGWLYGWHFNSRTFAWFSHPITS